MAATRAKRSASLLAGERPVLPLRSVVLFPGGVVGLQLSSEKSLALAAHVLETGEPVAIFASGEATDPAAEDPELAPVGVVCEVVQVLPLAPGQKQIFLHGIRRVRLLERVRTEPFVRARLGEVDESSETPELELNLLLGKALAAFETLVALDDRYEAETLELLEINMERGAGVVSDLLASHLLISVDAKQRVVEMLDPADRLRYLVDLCESQAARSAVEGDVSARVRRELDDKKREMLLREQLRVIRESLGEEHTPEREAEEYAARVRELPVDDDARRTLLADCQRLAVLSLQSAEYPLLHNYFETVFALPWQERTQDSLHLGKVERTLDRNHHGVEGVKERILEYLAVAKLKGDLAGPVLCLAGPPGTGKTSLARSIAEALGRRFVRISLGGISDESEIRGHRKTYVGAMPGKIVAAYLKSRSLNPVVLLDEIDKLGNTLRGDPASALLEVLDPEQSHAFLDRYLGIPFDLSETLFVTTANRLDTIPGPLRDRLEIITLAGYTEEEKIDIAKKYLLPATLEEHGLPAGSVRVDRPALETLIRSYTSEAGVRELARRLAALCRKVARHRASRGKSPKTVRVREKHLERYFGPPIFEHEFAERNPEVGVATGLAWTGAGGEILFIEAARMAGTGKVEVTGHLGDVMRESVQAAYSYVRSRAEELEIPTDKLGKHDVHIHFPAGAIPKDGPSAGTAVATCLASLLSGRPVRHDVAMTGEITLRGKVLRVGGVKEKVLAAYRARVRVVLLPEGNRSNLEEIPKEVQDHLEIRFVASMEEVWREALMPFLVIRKQDLQRFEKGQYAEA